MHNAAGPFVLSALIYGLFFIRWWRNNVLVVCAPWIRVRAEDWEWECPGCLLRYVI